MSTINLTNRTIFSDKGRSGYCVDDNDCSEDEECNYKNKCVHTYHRRGRCDTEVHVIVVEADDGEVNECAKQLHWNTRYLHSRLHPQKMDKYEVVRVHDCTDRHGMKNKMLRLERNRSITNNDVKVILAVVSNNDLSSCDSALWRLPRQMEKEFDFSCRDIRNMRDESVIRVSNKSQCHRWQLRDKVRRAADMNMI